MKYNGEIVKEFDAKSQAALISEPHGQAGLEKTWKSQAGQKNQA